MTDLQLGGLYEYRYDEEDCERREKAKLFLFKLATKLTNGYRDMI